jgi:hypothetical protein
MNWLGFGDNPILLEEENLVNAGSNPRQTPLKLSTSESFGAQMKNASHFLAKSGQTSASG